MISGFSEILARLTYAVGPDNPAALGTLFLLGVLTDIGIPLLFTVEVFLLFASYYVGPVSLQVMLIVLMLLLGRMAGGSALFWASYALGEPFLHWLNRHFPRLQKNLQNLKTRISRHTVTAVTLVRLTPGFLQVPSLAAGSLRLKYPHFLLGLVLSSLIYDLGIVFFGYIGRLILGDDREDLQDYFIVGFIIIIIITWVIFFFRYRRSLFHKK